MQHQDVQNRKKLRHDRDNDFGDYAGAIRERRQLMSILEKLLDEALEETGKSTRGLYKLS